MRDARIEKLADVLVRYSTGVRKSDLVVIAGTPPGHRHNLTAGRSDRLRRPVGAGLLESCLVTVKKSWSLFLKSAEHTPAALMQVCA